MKIYHFSALMLTGLLTVASCSDINDQEPQSGYLTQDQVKETNSQIPNRIDATIAGMYTMMGKPKATWPDRDRADDFGFIAAALSQDCEGADLVMADNIYNWFSTALSLQTRNADYANPYMRYKMPYNQIGVCQEIIKAYPAETTDLSAIHAIAQARAMRAFDYMALASYFQFSYTTSKDELCVPILADGVDYTNNPRATVAEVYKVILEDLDYAIEHLADFDRGSDKSRIDQKVAYGLRARANLAMGNWAAAAADAEKAMEGYTPASVSEVSVPGFNDITAHNWMWGIDITDAMVTADGAPTASSWFSPFSGNGYAAAGQNTPAINTLLYRLIPSTDVRKGWWLDAKLHSDHIANLTWTGVSGGKQVTVKGDAIATFVTDDGNKVAMLPYSNVKFGQKSGVGNSLNSNDFPLMRVEEMILIEAEGLAKSGNEAKAREVLTKFVTTYRDPQYTISTSRSLADEIWFQRRVELWGEGFFTSDAKRLGKNIVRFNANIESNFPDAFKFNISATDGWLNMRFPQTEKDNNLGIKDNTGGSEPVAGQNPGLRDGVTD